MAALAIDGVLKTVSELNLEGEDVSKKSSLQENNPKATIIKE
ncbi:hypothetical protein FEM21_01960 [Flavobacterium seoulense]|uniref:Uncharacterized protein n=1 Tax=Flavobacterium seoulense TaxID=1492738 RepID=A0A066WVS5_9FLAO|nr:hypothetical protein FEM21_01960 [Flavobacterium seoulense]